MKYKLKVYSIWEFGQRKDAEGNPHQEDCLYPPFGKATDADRTFILCDGMGGHDAGEVASATVCEAMSETIRNNGHDAEGIFTQENLSDAIAAAFDALDQKDNGAEKKMGTTMTFLKFHNEGVTIAHMGDSRVYHIRPGKTEEDTCILHVTEDHSLVNDLIKIGELTPEEARFSKQKNVITKAMQPHMERRPKAEIYTTNDIQPGDYFYMCSDGMLEEPDMEDGTVLKRIFSERVETDERRVEILRGATKDNRDNHTAFIIRVEEVSDSMTTTEEVTESTKQVDKLKEEEQAMKRMPVCKSRPNPFTRLKIFTGIAIIALGLLGVYLVKSCNPSPEKEKKEEPAHNHAINKPAQLTEPVKPVESVNNEQTPSNTPLPASYGTAIPAPQKEGVVSSDEQKLLEQLGTKKQ